MNRSSDREEQRLARAWRDLDAKFLSNDSPTNLQKLGHPVTPADRLEHILNHPSLYIRASDLTLFLENVSFSHLKQHFPQIVETIFGMHSGYPPWPLRTITKKDNPRETNVLLNLLGATGPLITLATKLMEDPGLLIQVGMDKLPLALCQRLYQGDIPAYFSSRLVVTTDPFPKSAVTSPVITGLRVNPFEHYFLSFTAHICSLGGTRHTYNYLLGWGTLIDSLYHNLLDSYLVYFFPCNGHGVPSDNFRLSTYQHQQLGNESMYPMSPNRMYQSPDFGLSSSPRLLKASLFLDQTQLPFRSDASLVGRRQVERKEVWRTETILLICTEMWMAHAPGIVTVKNLYPASTDKYGRITLPTVDVVKSVRMLVRHSHFFLNCITASVMHPMEELKRDAFAAYQKRLYKFLRHLFYHWPLDNSFRIVYETWLSYIQPWRYFHFERIRTSGEIGEPVDSRWNNFIQENILFYTKLFGIMLNRMSRMDFATTKNATLFYRVAKVFAGHEQLKLMLLDTDNLILTYEQPDLWDKSRGDFSRSALNSTYSSATASRLSSPRDLQKGTGLFRVNALKQVMRDWEHNEFNYEPLFCEANKRFVCGLLELAKNAKSQLQTLADKMEQQQRNQSWRKWFNKLMGIKEKEYESLNELNRGLSQLEVGSNLFAAFFEVRVVTERSTQSELPVFELPSNMTQTTFMGSSWEGSELEETESRVLILPPGTYSRDTFIPCGNPDLAHPKTDELSVLVRLTNQFSDRLNNKFAGAINSYYFQPNWKGKLARATFAEPAEYFELKRRGRVREKIRKVLPPRISLRFLCSIQFLLGMMAFAGLCTRFGLVNGVIPICLGFWLLYVIMRGWMEPEGRLDELIYLFGSWDKD